MQPSFTIAAFCLALVAAAPRRATARVASSYDDSYSSKPDYPSPPQSYDPVSDNYDSMPAASSHDNGDYSQGRGSAGYPPNDDNYGNTGPSQGQRSGQSHEKGQRSGQSPDQGQRSGQSPSKPGSGQRSGQSPGMGRHMIRNPGHQGNRGGNYPSYDRK
ncbi:hypothetical protein DSO57_1015338 [Entomophthora muscae]|uniref:Uncharacterized protein n=1 Tax=Entomophthora muscae TaxID=34485 RepID=A0ACC2UQ01_9FUNG|nr:hypothetical protein DSO57_1015338 [Entomophthora muscae]